MSAQNRSNTLNMMEYYPLIQGKTVKEIRKKYFIDIGYNKIDLVKTSQIAQTNKAIAAINGSFFNMDGGGSTTMWTKETGINKPSDKNGERPVANAVLILKNVKPGQ